MIMKSRYSRYSRCVPMVVCVALSVAVNQKGNTDVKYYSLLPLATISHSWQHNRFTDIKQEGKFMRLLLAIFLPWLQFFTIGRPIARNYLFGFTANHNCMDTGGNMICVRLGSV